MKKLAPVALLILVTLPLGVGTWLLHQEQQLVGPGSCELARNESITVVCSEPCGLFIEKAILNAANSRGVTVKIIHDLQQTDAPDLTEIDALIIPGGADIAPHYYTQHLPELEQQRIESLAHLVDYSEEGRRRDPYEYKLLRQYFGSDELSQTPVLGICRGMQMLAVSQGIPLIVDINTELGIGVPRYHLDRIAALPDNSELFAYLGKSAFPVAQLHHQAVDLEYLQKNAASLAHIRVSASSHDERIPEIMEWTNRPVIGTQFHPEYSLGAPRMGLFNWLLNSACEKKKIESRKSTET